MTGPARRAHHHDGRIGAAPFCGMLLGDLGADIIRIDALPGVDGPLPVDHTVRRSQRSLAADVKHPRGRDLVHRLAAEADAFVDVYRPGRSHPRGAARARPGRRRHHRARGRRRGGPKQLRVTKPERTTYVVGLLHRPGVGRTTAVGRRLRARRVRANRPDCQGISRPQ
ncbi:MAG TPA: CoA transferase [Mycobacterium sp.]|nr:CoA transferase [Mycobacterium sp.]